jgi:hypothetical protein
VFVTLQVKRARLGDMLARHQGDPVPELELTDNILDAADLYMKISDLFDYARDTNETRSSVKELRSALRLARIYDRNHPAMVRLHSK